MAKHKKTEDSTPEEGYKETIKKLLQENSDLREALHVAHYVTIDQFIEEYSQALRGYMKSQFSYRKDSDNLHHPEDLYSTAINFAEAVWHMHSEVDIRTRGKNIGF